jgi:hypothetical protein
MIWASSQLSGGPWACCNARQSMTVTAAPSIAMAEGRLVVAQSRHGTAQEGHLDTAIGGDRIGQPQAGLDDASRLPSTRRVPRTRRQCRTVRVDAAKAGYGRVPPRRVGIVGSLSHADCDRAGSRRSHMPSANAPTAGTKDHAANMRSVTAMTCWTSPNEP